MPLSKRKQGQTAILSKRKAHLYNSRTLQEIRRGSSVSYVNRRMTRGGSEPDIYEMLGWWSRKTHTFELLLTTLEKTHLNTLKNLYLNFRHNQRKHFKEELYNKQLHACKCKYRKYPSKLFNQLINTTVVVSKPQWFKINSRMHMAEIWLFNTSKDDDIQDIGEFVHVIPNFSEKESWNWKDGKEPCTHNVLIKGEEQEYVLCSSMHKKIDELNDDDKYFITSKTNRNYRTSKMGHQLRINRMIEPWPTQDGNFRTSQAEDDEDVVTVSKAPSPSHYFADTITANELLVKCFIDDGLSGRMAYCRNLPETMKEHLNKTSMTITVKSESKNASVKVQSRFLVVHVYAVVNDKKDDPSDTDTTWKVTGITLRNAQGSLRKTRNLQSPRAKESKRIKAQAQFEEIGLLSAATNSQYF